MISIVLLLMSVAMGELADDELGMLMLNTAVELDTAGGVNGVTYEEQSQETGEDVRDAAGNTEFPDEYIHFGYSYAPDETGYAPLYVRPTRQIFDYKATDFDEMPSAGAINAKDYSLKMQEISESISTSFGLSGGFMGFSASVKFSNSKCLKTDEKTMRADVRKGVEYRLITHSDDLLSPKEVWKRLTKPMQKFMLESTPQSISTTLGIVYPYQISYGALFKSTLMKKQSSFQETEAWKVDFEAGFANALASAQASTNFTSNNSHKTVHKDVHALSVAVGGDPREFHKSFDEWIESVGVHNMQPVQYQFRPLYELLMAVDAEKGKALRDEQEKRWGDEFYKLVKHDDLQIDPPLLTRCYGGQNTAWKYDNTGGTFPYKWGLRVDVVNPQICPGGMHYALGDVAHGDVGWKVPAQGTIMVSGPGARPPTGVNEIWHDNDGWHRGKVYELTCEDGYEAVGHVWTKNAGDQVNLQNYRCIPSRCVERKKPSVLLFRNYHWVYPPAHEGVNVYHHPGGVNMYDYFRAQLGWENTEVAEVPTIISTCFQN